MGETGGEPELRCEALAGRLDRSIVTEMSQIGTDGAKDWDSK
jgi:hypothetical protein